MNFVEMKIINMLMVRLVFLGGSGRINHQQYSTWVKTSDRKTTVT
jgi:hypothetical protein